MWEEHLLTITKHFAFLTGSNQILPEHPHRHSIFLLWKDGENWTSILNHYSHTQMCLQSSFTMSLVIAFKKWHIGCERHTISPTHLEALEACVTQLSHAQLTRRIAFLHHPLDILIAIEDLICFQTVLGTAVYSPNSCQYTVLVSTLLMRHFCKLTLWSQLMKNSSWASGFLLKMRLLYPSLVRLCLE